MNRRILLSAMFASASLFATAQYAAKTYAITGGAGGDFTWRNIRQIDIATGKTIKDIFVTGGDAKFVDGSTNKELSSADVERISSNDFVAASAFDVQSNKLFYSTMNSGQLRWIDMNDRSGVLHVYARQQQFSASNNLADEALNVTRMCIGADGSGYALTNDGNHLYRFSTDSKPVVTDLGNLVDAEANAGLSVHNKCSSWGGDMVADAFGKLYIVTANRNVFAVDVNSRVATFKGAITGLPGTYTTNGAAVDDNGDIIVNSSLNKEGYYKVKFPDLTATKIEGSDNSFSISDMANGNLLLQREADAQRNIGAPVSKFGFISSGNEHVFPNPAINSIFNVAFNGVNAGKYVITVTDLSGKALMSKPVTVAGSGQVESINVAPKLAIGMYMVKVSDSNAKNVFTEKVVMN